MTMKGTYTMSPPHGVKGTYTTSPPHRGDPGGELAATGKAAVVVGFRRTDAIVRHVRERKVVYSALTFTLMVGLAIIWHRYTQFM